MKVRDCFGLFSVIFLLLISCAREPLTVTQTEYRNQKMFVTLEGPTQKVDQVVATVREFPSYTFTFRDNGQQGDATAGDDVWTYEFTEDYGAEPGLYHMEISVKTDNGEEVVTEEFAQQQYGKSGTIEVPLSE
ncbi:MAG TPA: choice-of-anchor X domain-containing protein [bacterium]|nr:choice-of-anchor X domain-containing protein [bacterium]